MPATAQTAIGAIGIDIGKNSFHIVGLDDRGAIVLRQKWSRNQVEVRFANMPPYLIGMEACVGAHPSCGPHQQESRARNVAATQLR
jgi:transposase